MEKKYICTMTGKKKETKEPFSVFSAITESANFSTISLKDTFSVPENHPLLEVRVLKG